MRQMHTVQSNETITFEMKTTQIYFSFSWLSLETICWQ